MGGACECQKPRFVYNGDAKVLECVSCGKPAPQTVAPAASPNIYKQYDEMRMNLVTAASDAPAPAPPTPETGNAPNRDDGADWKTVGGWALALLELGLILGLIAWR